MSFVASNECDVAARRHQARRIVVYWRMNMVSNSW